jgi:hypothetical protein
MRYSGLAALKMDSPHSLRDSGPDVLPGSRSGETIIRIYLSTYPSVLQVRRMKCEAAR